MNYSLPTLQVFWAIGALERLSTLGFLAEPPLQVSAQAIDFFVELDEYRNNLFPDDTSLKELVTTIIKTETPNTPEEDIKLITNLVCEYKNERTDMVKYAMKLQTQE